MFFRVIVLVMVFAVAGCLPKAPSPKGKGQSKTPFVPSAEAIREHNQGVALMGQFEFGDAIPVFKKLVDKYPDWLDAKVDLAIATFNRNGAADQSGKTDVSDAIAMLKEVLKRDPEDIRANYCLAILLNYSGQWEQALPLFERVAREDPRDAHAVYMVGYTLRTPGKREAEALEWFKKARALDPYFKSATFGAYDMLRLLGREAERDAMKTQWERINANPQAKSFEMKYTLMGNKALVKSYAVNTPPALPRESRVFEDPSPMTIAGAEGLSWQSDVGERPRSITAADLNGDGMLDLFVAGAFKGEMPNAVLLGQKDGGYTLDRSHPVAAVTDVRAASWADINNDGKVDVYLSRKGPNQLWEQDAAGSFVDRTAETQTSGGDHDTLDAIVVDADHDADLDLFLVQADGPCELLSNPRQGAYKPIAKEQGLQTTSRPRMALFSDLDGDRDLDIVVINEQPPHNVFENDRLWSYVPYPGLEEFRDDAVSACVAGDLDADGDIELIATGTDMVTLWSPDAEGKWTPTRLGKKASYMISPNPQLALADVNGDGRHDLLATRVNGWAAFQFRDTDLHLEDLFSANVQGGLQGWELVASDSQRGPSLVAGDAKGLHVWKPGAGRFAFLSLELAGKEDKGVSARSNLDGIGTRLRVKVGDRWSVVDAGRIRNQPGQSSQPLQIGLGGAEQADFVEFLWPDGLFQTEIAVASGPVRDIPEIQRQTSSCPLLFAWDGRQFAFVSDLLGTGGMGTWIAPGQFVTPDPTENFLFPAGLLVPDGGRFRLKFSEPMEEVTYLDSVALSAWDLPSGWQMALDERMAINGPPATGEPIFYRRSVTPKATVGDADVTDRIVETDGKAIDPGPRDERFVGRLANESVITLHFDEPLDRLEGRPVLLASGWIEYPYAQTLFGAWQAGCTFDAPSLEARGADGKWVALASQFGYPAGMPRQMAFPLPALPSGTTALRLRTNQEVYWDRLEIVLGEDCPDARRQACPLALATLVEDGFPRRTLLDQNRPTYSDVDRKRWDDIRSLPGLHTAFGPVDELVGPADDAVAILGAGEDIHLEFEVPAEALASGWSRRFVLESVGWCKDMDLYTLDGESVEPIPSRQPRSASAEALHAKYHTRMRIDRASPTPRSNLRRGPLGSPSGDSSR